MEEFMEEYQKVEPSVQDIMRNCIQGHKCNFYHQTRKDQMSRQHMGKGKATKKVFKETPGGRQGILYSG